MSDPYIGEIRLFGFPRVPQGWFACDGTLYSIAEYEVLYTLLGTTYGGNGQTTFGVPDLRGRIPLHFGTLPGGSTYAIGQMAGAESVTLLTTQMPAHTHPVVVSAANGSSNTPGPALFPAAISGDSLYAATARDATKPLAFGPTIVSAAGGGLPHENMMPTQTANYCIAWSGIYPTQS